MRHQKYPRGHLVYAILDRDGKTMYIGATTNLNRRASCHNSSRDCPLIVRWRESIDYPMTFKILAQFTTKTDMLAFERAALYDHNPPLNIIHTSKHITWSEYRAANPRGLTGYY